MIYERFIKLKKEGKIIMKIVEIIFITLVISCTTYSSNALPSELQSTKYSFKKYVHNFPSEETETENLTKKPAIIGGMGIEINAIEDDWEKISFLPLVNFDLGFIFHSIEARAAFKTIYVAGGINFELVYQLIANNDSYLSIYGGGGGLACDENIYSTFGIGVEYGLLLHKYFKGNFLYFQLGTNVIKNSIDTDYAINSSIGLRHRWTFGHRKKSSRHIRYTPGSIYLRAGGTLIDPLAAGIGVSVLQPLNFEARIGCIPIPSPPLSAVFQTYYMKAKKGFQHGPCAAFALISNWDGSGLYSGAGYRIQYGRGSVRLGAELLVFVSVSGKNWGLPIVPAPGIFAVWNL